MNPLIIGAIVAGGVIFLGISGGLWKWHHPKHYNGGKSKKSRKLRHKKSMRGGRPPPPPRKPDSGPRGNIVNTGIGSFGMGQGPR